MEIFMEVFMPPWDHRVAINCKRAVILKSIRDQFSYIDGSCSTQKYFITQSHEQQASLSIQVGLERLSADSGGRRQRLEESMKQTAS